LDFWLNEWAWFSVGGIAEAAELYPGQGFMPKKCLGLSLNEIGSAFIRRNYRVLGFVPSAWICIE
jgi:hypothetical protein